MANDSTNSLNSNSLVYNGIPWYDDQGNIVNAHGACIVEENGKYYLFGEWKSDESNAFPGFSCYSSEDLVNWKFEKVVLSVQKGGILGPNRVGERVKVMKCPSTGEFVMYMHADDMQYKDPQIGYATSKTIAGDYKFQGPLLYKGEPIRKWDMGTFQDTDGTGYLLIHHGIIYRLSDDYRSAEKKVLDGLKNGGESPAMFKKNGLYYLLGSGLTGWERNDNFYFTAPAVEGPWTRQGFFAPEGSLTHNSQTTFVFPLIRNNDTIPIFMGDRWSYPHQASAATYVWMPMRVDGEKLSIPEYWEAWDPTTVSQADPLVGGKEIATNKIHFNNPNKWEKINGRFASDLVGSYMEIPFHGTKAIVVGESNSISSYAKISIYNSKKEIIFSSLVDFYSKVPYSGVQYMSPVLPKDDYLIKIETTGIVQEWRTKKGTRYGSNGFYVTVEKCVVFE